VGGVKILEGFGVLFTPVVYAISDGEENLGEIVVWDWIGDFRSFVFLGRISIILKLRNVIIEAILGLARTLSILVILSRGIPVSVGGGRLTHGVDGILLAR